MPPRVPGLRDRAQRATSPCCPSRVGRSRQSWASPCELRTRHSRALRPCAAGHRPSAPGRAGCSGDSHSGRSSSRVPSHASGVTSFEWPAQVFADHRVLRVQRGRIFAMIFAEATLRNWRVSATWVDRAPCQSRSRREPTQTSRPAAPRWTSIRDEEQNVEAFGSASVSRTGARDCDRGRSEISTSHSQSESCKFN